MRVPDVSLHAVAEVIMGQSPDGCHYNNDGEGKPLLTGSGQMGEKYPQCTQYSRTGAKASRKGDIILSIRASIGDLNWSDRDYYLGRGVAAIRPLDKLDRGYCWWVLHHTKSKLESCATGSTFKQVKTDDVRNLVIPLPPLEEQRRIAAILNKADALRQKRRLAFQKLDFLKQSIFLDMFGDPGRNPKRLRQEPLDGFLSFVTSGARGWAEYYASTGTRFIRSLDVQMNHIPDADPAYVVAPDNAEARRTRVKAGDVLLTITGSRIGRVSPVPPELEGAFISQHVAILRLGVGKLHPEFLAYFLSLDAGGQRQIASAQYGQTKPGLNFEQIRRFKVPVPTITEQWEFVRRVHYARRIETLMGHNSISPDRLFASLQQCAFGGDL